MKEIELQEHHVTRAEAFLTLAGGKPSLAARLQHEWLKGEGYWTTTNEKNSLLISIQTAYDAVNRGSYEVIPDGEPDVICRACRKKKQNLRSQIIHLIPIATIP